MFVEILKIVFPFTFVAFVVGRYKKSDGGKRSENKSHSWSTWSDIWGANENVRDVIVEASCFVIVKAFEILIIFTSFINEMGSKGVIHKDGCKWVKIKC